MCVWRVQLYIYLFQVVLFAVRSKVIHCYLRYIVMHRKLMHTAHTSAHRHEPSLDVECAVANNDVMWRLIKTIFHVIAPHRIRLIGDLCVKIATNLPVMLSSHAYLVYCTVPCAAILFLISFDSKWFRVFTECAFVLVWTALDQFEMWFNGHLNFELHS